MKLKMNLLNNKNRNSDGLSFVSGSQRSAALQSYTSGAALSKHTIPRVNDKISRKSDASSRFSALRRDK